jgi:hypothetical protein
MATREAVTCGHGDCRLPAGWAVWLPEQRIDLDRLFCHSHAAGLAGRHGDVVPAGVGGPVTASTLDRLQVVSALAVCMGSMYAVARVVRVVKDVFGAVS